jgi:hypothetical protein
VRAELQNHLAGLQSHLVEVINADFNDFVNLSTKLVSVDGAVQRMQQPLLDVKVQRSPGRRGGLAPSREPRR